jgi:hypothetical protein
MQLRHKGMFQISNKKQANSVALIPQTNYTDRETVAADEIVPTFAGRECRVISAMNSYGR